MTRFIIIMKEYRHRPAVLPQICSSLDEGVGAAVIALDAAMRKAGFTGIYQLLCPAMEEGVVNLTAVSEKRQGYPEQLMVDAYVAPVALGGSIADEFAKEATA